MSKYTTELRFICEWQAGLNQSEGYLMAIKEIIEKARPIIFAFHYPIFDEAYKPVIETKILKHYYTREICCETYGRWKLFLDAKMNEIMPYYNQLYKSELLEFNPLYDTDITRDHKKDNSGDSTGRGTANGKLNRNTGSNENFWEMYSDTPQGGLDGIDSNTYLTNATHRTDAITGTQNDTTNDTTTTANQYADTEDYLEHVVGKSPGISYSKMLSEYRDTFLNIDMMVINDLEDLFFSLW